MTYRFAGIAICFAGLVLLSEPAPAAIIAPCDATFTMCAIPENILLQLPFVAIAGDTILTEPGGSTVSDVFRIFNNIVPTGFGTGLGNMAFLYSADDSALPSPSTYSANAVLIAESPSGVTPYLGNGTNYLLAVPEPQTFGSLGLACLAMAILTRSRLKNR
jgi:hypothetical protein